MMRALAIALLATLPAMSIAGQKTETVDIQPVETTPGVSVVIARFAAKKPMADADGAYAFVDAQTVAGAPLPANLSVLLPSPPKGGGRPVILLIRASPSGALTAEDIAPAKGGLACAPFDWLTKYGLATKGGIMIFPPTGVCFPAK